MRALLSCVPVRPVGGQDAVGSDRGGADRNSGRGMSGPLWLVGAGNMGGAMLRGWLANGIDPRDVTVVDPFAKDMPDGVSLHRELPEGGAPDILVLAIKPQQLSALAATYQARAKPPRLLLSVLAGGGGGGAR